ncbi:TPA: terminase small subunit [Streptococcus suis]
MVVKISTEEKLKKEIADLANQLMADWPSTRERQKQFVLEYVANGFINASEAVRNAGYSPKTANKQANNLLSGVDKYGHISIVVDKLKKAYDERNEALKIATGTEILQILTKHARRESIEYEVTKEGNVVETPTTVANSIKASELIGKSYALFTDKSEITGDMSVMIVDDIDE